MLVSKEFADDKMAGDFASRLRGTRYYDAATRIYTVQWIEQEATQYSPVVAKEPPPLQRPTVTEQVQAARTRKRIPHKSAWWRLNDWVAREMEVMEAVRQALYA